VKQSVYDADRRLSALLVTPISQAAANQRAGRAGRTCPGKCFRLYTAESFAELEAQTVAEIKRSNLSSVILTLMAAGVQDVVGFPYIDPPPTALLAAAASELFHLGAIDQEAILTTIGRSISTLPLDPMFAKTVVTAAKFGCSAEIAALVAILAEPGQVFIRPRDSQPQADSAHGQFKSTWGDHMALLNVFQAFQAAADRREWCRQNFLNFRVLSRADVARGQICSILRALGIPVVGIEPGIVDREPNILRALLEGMFMQVAMLNFTSGAYLFVDGSKEAAIHPSSCLKRKPEWVLYTNYVYTSKEYIRTVSEIFPDWLLEAAPTFFSQENLKDGLIKRALARVESRVAEKHKYR
jgi:pre-mRNA-splicing factor ATP-dependent RNA helicase DHX15/PRP43